MTKFVPKALETFSDYVAMFEHFGVERSLGLVRDLGHLEFQVPNIPNGLLDHIAEWKYCGYRVELVVKDFWKSTTPKKHLFFETRLGQL